MFKILKNKKAQNTLENALLIAAVIGAFVAIKIFMKRGVEGKLKSSSDSIGKQYDVQTTSSEFTVERKSSSKETTKASADTYTTNLHCDSTTKNGWERVGAPQ